MSQLPHQSGYAAIPHGYTTHNIGGAGAHDRLQTDAAPATYQASAGYTVTAGAFIPQASQRSQRDGAVVVQATAQQMPALQHAPAGRVAAVGDGRARDARAETMQHTNPALPESGARMAGVYDGSRAGDSAPNYSHLNHGYSAADGTAVRPVPSAADGMARLETATAGGGVSTVVHNPGGVAFNLQPAAGSGYANDASILPHGVSPVTLSGPGGLGRTQTYTLPAANDGIHSGRDSMAATAGVPVLMPYVEQPRTTAVPDRVPNTRTTAFAPVSNSRTLYWTGQSAAPTSTMPALSEMDTHGDSRDDFGPLSAHTAMIREAYTRAHPSTQGDAAEFRNVYHTALRKGLVEANIETLRAATNPQRLQMEAALAAQLARSAAAQANPDPIMCRTIDAYESDAMASDMDG